MDREYDFSHGIRGKFYRPDIEINTPIYLEPDIAKILQDIAKAHDMPIDVLVNRWLRHDIGLFQENRTHLS